MYQLFDYNVDRLVIQQQLIYLLGMGKDAIEAYKRILIRSIQLGRTFDVAGV